MLPSVTLGKPAYMKTMLRLQNIKEMRRVEYSAIEIQNSRRRLDKRISSWESARRYFSTKKFMFKLVPNVFVLKLATI